MFLTRCTVLTRYCSISTRGTALAVVATVLLALAGCTAREPAAGFTPSPASPAPAEAPAGAPHTLPSGTPIIGGGPGERPAAIQEFSIRGRAFTPAAKTLPVGTVGLWTNNSDEEHLVAGPDWELGPIAPGQAWAHTFKATEVGNVTVRCKIHPEMTGSVTVTPAP